jgi:hypothetical protein
MNLEIPEWKKAVKFIGILLWSLVFVVVMFFSIGNKKPDNKNLKTLCDEFKEAPQKLTLSKLGEILSGLNELHLSDKEKSLQWMDSCTGLIMVEMKSRSFEKKLQKPLPKKDSSN